jgi:hypothetical protein
MLLPEPIGNGGGAVACSTTPQLMIVGAMLIALHSSKYDIPEVARLLNNEDDLIKGHVVADS